MNALLRRSTIAAASSASRHAVVVLLAADALVSQPLLAPAAAAVLRASGEGATWPCGRPSVGKLKLGIGGSRSFHFSAAPRGFRASDVAGAQYALDEAPLWEEERPNGQAEGEGLEISKLGIAPEIVEALSRRGITKLFPIQRAVFEPAMKGCDMIGRARTGTGKTLAFGIPIVDKIIKFNEKNGRGVNPLALVLAPTRELARQVEKEFKESTRSIDTLCVYGGSPIGQQMRTLNYGVDIVVGTPGRVIDLLGRGALNLGEVQFVVLDEADQMLNIGFKEDVEKIMESLPERRQTMLFSATIPTWIQNIARVYLKHPVSIDLVGDSRQKLAEGITLYSIATDNFGRASIIGPLITEHAKGGKCIVFTQTKRDADRLAYCMAKNYKCESLHGDISQNQRERTLAGFRDGHFNILVATDVAARGLDIPNVDLVIHFELPTTSEIFVHRSGRTGRAGKKGSVILIYTEQQTRAVRQTENDIGCRFNELPKIKSENNMDDFFTDMRGPSSSFREGRQRSPHFGGSNDLGRSGFGRPSSFGGPGLGGSGNFRAGGYGNSGLRSGSFRDLAFGNSGLGPVDRNSAPDSFRRSSFGDSATRQFGREENSGSRR